MSVRHNFTLPVEELAFNGTFHKRVRDVLELIVDKIRIDELPSKFAYQAYRFLFFLLFYRTLYFEKI